MKPSKHFRYALVATSFGISLTACADQTDKNQERAYTVKAEQDMGDLLTNLYDGNLFGMDVEIKMDNCITPNKVRERTVTLRLMFQTDRENSANDLYRSMMLASLAQDRFSRYAQDKKTANVRTNPDSNYTVSELEKILADDPNLILLQARADAALIESSVQNISVRYIEGTEALLRCANTPKLPA